MLQCREVFIVRRQNKDINHGVLKIQGWGIRQVDYGKAFIIKDFQSPTFLLLPSDVI